MMDFLRSLEQSPLIVWIRESGSIWGYPTILFLHTVGMAMVAGLSAAIDLRLLGFPPRAPIKPLERIYPLIWTGFAINLTTGAILLIADTSKLTNADFYVKMVFVFAGVAILYLMRDRVFGHPALDKSPVTGSMKGLAWISLVCWVGAITAGRLLAYTGPVVPGFRNR